MQPVIPLPDDSLRQNFEATVMGSAPFASTALLASTPSRMVALVARTPGAIGLAPLSQPAEGVKVVRVDGQLADPARLDAAIYPLTFAVVAVGATQPAAPIYDFLVWRQSQATTDPTLITWVG